MKKCFLTFLFLLCPALAGAEGVIGLDTVFNLTVLPMLTPDPLYPEYAQIFNYFVTIEIFAGLVGLFIRVVLRTFRM